MLSASVLTSFVTSSFEKTIQGFESSGLDCPVGISAEEEGPSTADLGGHKVEFISSNYDEENDVTRVGYKVTSHDKPAISHWILAFPPELWPLLEVEGEGKIEYGVDPSTGINGVKMDTGFDPKEGGKKTFNPDLGGIMLTGTSARRATEVREVYFSLVGHYELTVVQIGLKAGGSVFLGTIVAQRKFTWKT